MQTILIKDVLLGGARTNVLIEGNRFKSLCSNARTADKVIDGSRMAILPPFYNAHTHAAMSLLRGYADDMPLQKWLSEYIWPFEDTLTSEDIYNGSRLAILEMIKSGTVFFSDMYFALPQTIKAIDEMGVRAALGVTFMSAHSQKLRDEKAEFMRSFKDPTGGRISITAAPHAIYTADRTQLLNAASLARELGLKLHIHLSETAKEVSDCLAEHGTTPVRYLDSLGFLGPDVVAAHVVHVDDEEIEILRARGVVIAHCPCSNMKLGSGIFRYKPVIDSGVKVCLATDGDSSNNNLDMREEMKFAALLAKSGGDPELLPAAEVLKWATRNGAQTFGIDAGTIEEGRLADCLLVDLGNERLTPCHNLVSNWVYAADSSCIDTVICDGRILMEGRHVEGEEEILSRARRSLN